MKVYRPLLFFLQIASSFFQVLSTPMGIELNVTEALFALHSSDNTESPALYRSSRATSSSTVLHENSSLLRRDLKKSSADLFFFEECSKICTKNGGVPSKVEGDCCKGGIGYLKVVFTNPVGGTVAVDPSELASIDNVAPSCLPSGSQSRYGPKGTKSSSIEQSSKVRLVSCDDLCVTEPFHDHSCVNTKASITIGAPQSEICFVMIDSSTNKVTFDVKMPTNLEVWFVSNQGQVSAGTIHTSCSRPLSPPWGVAFVEHCNTGETGSNARRSGSNSHVQIDKFVSTPYLSFVDGISTKYFGAVKSVLDEEDTESYTQNFSIGFEKCGCTCDNFIATSVSPSTDPTSSPSTAPSPIHSKYPSQEPSEAPNSSPSVTPSISPTIDPSTSPSFEPSVPPTIAPIDIISPVPSSPPTPTATSTSSSSSTGDANQGPGAPSLSTMNPSCSSSCLQYISAHCVIRGSNDSCNIGANIPVFDDDSTSAGAVAATLIPNFPAGKGTKGSKGGKGFPKNSGSKSGKATAYYNPYGKAKAGGKGQKSKGWSYYIPYHRNKRHLQQIQYHQSRIAYYEELLKRIEG